MSGGNGQATADLLRSFAACLYDPDDTVEIRCIVPRDVQDRLIYEHLLHPEKATKEEREQAAKLVQKKHGRFIVHQWCRAADLPSRVEWCRQQNTHPVLKYGIYVGANPRRKHGGTKRRDVKCYRTVFVDIDDTHDIHEVRRRIKDAGLPEPTLIVDSGHGYHCYWLLSEPIEDLDRGKEIISRLVRVLGGDRGVKDPPRVMRLPGFLNTKEPAAGTSIIEAEPDRRCAIEKIERCLPEVTQGKSKPSADKQIPAASNLSHEDRISQAMTYMARCPSVAEHPGDDNEGRNNAAVRHAANLRNDLHLTEDEARPILATWNLKNSPPLDEPELEECLCNGGKYGTHKKGVKLRPHQRHLTDAGNAERLYDYHSDRLRYCPEVGRWCAWDERRWDFQTGNIRANQYALQAVRNIARTEANVLSLGKEERERLFKWSLISENRQRLSAQLTCAQNIDGFVVHQNDFDRDPYLLNCLNGTIDLRTGELRPHNPSDLITKLCPVEYDPNARSQTWEDHLAKVTGNDEALIEFLQLAAGYSATGDTGEEVLFLIHGPTAGGKTTTLETLKSVLGDYAQTADFETFLRRNQAGGIRNDVARLAGARLVLSVEVDEGKQLAEGLVKQLTGGDTMTARFLHQEYFEFRPQCKLWLVCNDAPRARDTDDALWRRIIRVPFDHTIPKHERDPKVKTRLKDPRTTGPAVLTWIVQGCLKWKSTGLVVPQAIERATRELREDQDPIRDFLEDECEFSTAAFVPVREMRKAYEEYAEGQGIRYPLGPREYNRRLEARGCERKAKRYYNNTGTEKVEKCWIGVALQNGAQYAECNDSEGGNEGSIPF